MFNGIVYNQGIIKSIKKSPKYVNGSLVIELKSDISFKKNDIGESVSAGMYIYTIEAGEFRSAKKTVLLK